jgi:hypothetical protein
VSVGCVAFESPLGSDGSITKSRRSIDDPVGVSSECKGQKISERDVQTNMHDVSDLETRYCSWKGKRYRRTETRVDTGQAHRHWTPLPHTTPMRLPARVRAACMRGAVCPDSQSAYCSRNREHEQRERGTTEVGSKHKAQSGADAAAQNHV